MHTQGNDFVSQVLAWHLTREATKPKTYIRINNLLAKWNRSEAIGNEIFLVMCRSEKATSVQAVRSCLRVIEDVRELSTIEREFSCRIQLVRERNGNLCEYWNKLRKLVSHAEATLEGWSLVECVWSWSAWKLGTTIWVEGRGIFPILSGLLF